MKKWFEREWRLTSIYWRTFLLGWTVFIFFRFALAAINYASLGEIDRCIRLVVYGVCVILLDIWWPFGIAAAARRRSRSFGWWLFFSLTLSPLIVGLAYLVVKSESLPSSDIDSPPGAMSRAEKLRMLGVEALVENESPAQAIPLLREAADMGDAVAQFLIGSFYAAGSGVPQDSAVGANWLYKAAVQGHPTAQLLLANLYVTGQGVPQNFTSAVHWLQLAAQQGDADAQHGLGFLYATGQGVARDSAETARWYSKAAEQGHADAQNDLGVLYAMGEGVEHDEIQAETLFIAAAAQGNSQAKSNLAGIRAAREETDDDVSDYLKAANDGDPVAQCILAAFYERGVHVPMDVAEAARWYRRAAEQGSSHAQHNLGQLYRTGRGVARSSAEAFFWLYVASSGTLDVRQRDYPKARDAVGLTIPPREREEVIREAERWLNVHTAAILGTHAEPS